MLFGMMERLTIPEHYDARRRELLRMFDRCDGVCGDLMATALKPVPGSGGAFEGRMAQMVKALTIILATMSRLLAYILTPRAPGMRARDARPQYPAPQGADASPNKSGRPPRHRQAAIRIPDTLGFIAMVHQLDRQVRIMIRRDQEWRFGPFPDAANATPSKPAANRAGTAARITREPRVLSLADDPICPLFVVSPFADTRTDAPDNPGAQDASSPSRPKPSGPP